MRVDDKKKKKKKTGSVFLLTSSVSQWYSSLIRLHLKREENSLNDNECWAYWQFHWIATFCFKSGVTSSSQPFLPYCLSFRDLYMLHSIFMTYSLSARRLAMSTDESKFCNIMQHIWRTEAVCTCAYTEGFCTSFTPGDDFILILLTEAVPKHLLSKLGFLLT